MSQIPALASPGLEAPFEVRLMSGVAVELVPLPELKSVVLQVRWSRLLFCWMTDEGITASEGLLVHYCC